MTLPIAFVLTLLVIAIALFATERISVDIITFILLIALVVGGVLGPAEAFEGFSNDIIIILGAIFVISGALQETGVLDLLGARILKLAGTNPNRLLLLLTSSTAGVSAFMNNTTVTAMFLPPTIGVARRANLSPSRLLMPLAFASILGGTCTLIGTSTNVAVSGYIKKAGMPELGMFEITPIGLVIVAVGIAYMMLVGRHLLPEHKEASLTVELRDARIRERDHRAAELAVDRTGQLRLRPERPRVSDPEDHPRRDASCGPGAKCSLAEGDTLLVEGQGRHLDEGEEDRRDRDQAGVCAR